MFMFVAVWANAQYTEYKTFIYTSDDLAKEITQEYESRKTRAGYLNELLNASKESMKGIASGYIAGIVDLSVNAIASLVTRNARLKKEWEETVKAENVYETKISTISELNDFYKKMSFEGAMDPDGMQFDGIGCLRTEGEDTVFYISCHIDRSKINRIINHSKFELVLDTLIVSPFHSNLPNTPLDLPFSFEERQNYCLTMDIKIISSWMSITTQLQKDQQLGSFKICIPINKDSLDKDGFLHYVRKNGEESAYKIVGESFIVPRSLSGYRTENEYRNCWGTGQYKLSIVLKETCNITDQYRKQWKKDRKRRKKMNSQKDFFDTTWQVISNQRWDELIQSWVITTLQAPANIITNDLIKKMKLDQEQKQKDSSSE